MLGLCWKCRPGKRVEILVRELLSRQADTQQKPSSEAVSRTVVKYYLCAGLSCTAPRTIPSDPHPRLEVPHPFTCTYHSPGLKGYQTPLSPPAPPNPTSPSVASLNELVSAVPTQWFNPMLDTSHCMSAGKPYRIVRSMTVSYGDKENKSPEKPISVASGRASTVGEPGFLTALMHPFCL